MSDEKIQSFGEFWPFYLGEHRDPKNRALHYIGTTLVLLALVTALVLGQYLLFFLIPVLGYGFAWVGHFIIERNRPATFTYPAWSLIADFKMFFYAVTQRMPGEMIKYYGSVHPAKEAPRVDPSPN